MKILTLTRNRRWDSTDGRPGILDIEGIPTFPTIELPWKNNQADISCVSIGEYLIERFYSQRFKMELFRLLNVPNRDAIEIHPANTIHDLLGCIGLGLSFGIIDTKGHGQVWGVRDSRAAISQFMAKMTGENLAKLVITEV